MKPATSASEVLGSPLRINSLELKNRIILGPMAVLRPTDDGRPSTQSIAFLRRRAQGGVGLVFVGGAVASERAWNESPFFPNIRFDKDEFVPDLARMVVAVQEEGAAIFAQLFPSFGRMGVPRNGAQPIAASPKPVVLGAAGLPRSRLRPGRPHHPTAGRGDGGGHQVGRGRRRRAPRAARRLPASTASRSAPTCATSTRRSSRLSSNQRTDEYGGSAENRARALRDTVAAVRAEVGPDYPVGIRMSVNDHMPGGQGPDGFAEVAGHIVTAGVDFISLSEANYESMAENVPSQSGNMLAHGEPQAFRAAVGGIPLFLSSTPIPSRRPMRSAPATPTRRCWLASCSRTPTMRRRSSTVAGTRSSGAITRTPACGVS